MTRQTYIMFEFEWIDNPHVKYEYVFDRATGQIAYDIGYMDGNPEDYRFVFAINALTRLSQFELEGAGNDLFNEDLPMLGKALAQHAGFDNRNILHVPPSDGTCIFVWDWIGGVSESTPAGPGEGWSDMNYVGELGELSITNVLNPVKFKDRI